MHQGPEGGVCDGPIRLQMTSGEGEGYLASMTTHETGYGSADCPWVIRVLDGQRIQLTLLDFTYRMAQNDLHLAAGEFDVKVNIESSFT